MDRVGSLLGKVWTRGSSTVYLSHTVSKYKYIQLIALHINLPSTYRYIRMSSHFATIMSFLSGVLSATGTPKDRTGQGMIGTRYNLVRMLRGTHEHWRDITIIQTRSMAASCHLIHPKDKGWMMWLVYISKAPLAPNLSSVSYPTFTLY